jgi:hypothetical protein
MRELPEEHPPVTVHFVGGAILIAMSISAGLAVVFLLLFFGIVIAPAVFVKVERAERARGVLADLVPWMPLLHVVIRRGAPAHLVKPSADTRTIADGLLEPAAGSASSAPCQRRLKTDPLASVEL